VPFFHSNPHRWSGQKQLHLVRFKWLSTCRNHAAMQWSCDRQPSVSAGISTLKLSKIIISGFQTRATHVLSPVWKHMFSSSLSSCVWDRQQEVRIPDNYPYRRLPPSARREYSLSHTLLNWLPHDSKRPFTHMLKCPYYDVLKVPDFVLESPTIGLH